MKKLLIIFLFYSVAAISQNRWVAQDVVKLDDADIYLEIGDYKTALKMYSKLYTKYGATENMEYKIGLCNYYLGNKEEAKEYFERATESGNPSAHFYLGLYYHENESFEEAKKHFQIFKNKEGKKDFKDADADRRIECADRAKKMIANPIEAKVYNLGQNVNTEFDDYGPLITADESTLTFTSRRMGTTGDKKDPYGEYLEDIYFSRNVDDKWTAAINAGEPLNSKTHDAAVGLSSNGNSMIIYRTNKELTAGDLYLSNYTDGAWGIPVLLSEAINSEYQESSACIADDGRVIYFSSNRPGGYGGKDLYRVVKISENIWSLPLNLGPTVNTEFDEDAPFLHPDGKTLYFSSKGHNNIGGYDIFRTTMNDEYWSTPENIGYPANTVRDDIFFVLTADGKRGYYSTELPDGFGGHDIYAITFENSLEKLRIIKGNISDTIGNPLNATITLLDENNETTGIYSTNAVSGNYIIILPPDLTFKMDIESDGFDDISDEVFYQGGTNLKEVLRNFKMSKTTDQ